MEGNAYGLTRNLALLFRVVFPPLTVTEPVVASSGTGD
jgi:hypothetical protein